MLAIFADPCREADWNLKPKCGGVFISTCCALPDVPNYHGGDADSRLFPLTRFNSNLNLKLHGLKTCEPQFRVFNIPLVQHGNDGLGGGHCLRVFHSLEQVDDRFANKFLQFHLVTSTGF